MVKAPLARARISKKKGWTNKKKGGGYLCFKSKTRDCPEIFDFDAVLGQDLNLVLMWKMLCLKKNEDTKVKSA